jgi:hypothetical protein
VLPLVPAEATTLEVTDFEQARLELGLGDLSEATTPAEQAAFWQRATAESPLLSEGLLGAAGSGLNRDDVAWEARFDTSSGEGWVMGLADGVDLDAVARAVTAGTGPLAGAELDPQNRILLNGAAPDADSSWAAEDDLAALVPDTAAQATFVTRACESEEVAGDTGDLIDLEAFSLSFGGTLATVRLGEDRADVFDRSALSGDPRFGRAFADVVADPGTGRIGYRLADPALAADLTLAGRLPFATCA